MVVPNIPGPGPIILVELAKKAIDWIVDKFKNHGDETGKNSAISSDSSAEDVAKINESLESFRDQAAPLLTEVEKKLAGQIDAYAGDLVFLVGNESDLLGRYNIRVNRFQRQARRLSESVDGLVRRAVGRRVSLDDPDCRRAAAMLPGEKKQEAFRAVYTQAVAKGLAESAERLRGYIDDLSEDFEETAADALGEIGRAASSQGEALATLGDGADSEAQERLAANAAAVIAACDLVLNAIGEN